MPSCALLTLLSYLHVQQNWASAISRSYCCNEAMHNLQKMRLFVSTSHIADLTSLHSKCGFEVYGFFISLYGAFLVWYLFSLSIKCNLESFCLTLIYITLSLHNSCFLQTFLNGVCHNRRVNHIVQVLCTFPLLIFSCWVKLKCIYIETVS